jgi:hypothetical protein
MSAEGAKKEINNIVEGLKDFGNDSVRFLNRCNKPDKKGI